MKFQLNAAGENGRAELRLYGDIGSWWDGNTAQEFAHAVDGITAKELDVYINSYGGDAHAGLAMHYTLRRFAARGTLRTHNDGIVASAAVAPFLAGDERLSPEGSVLMIHQAAAAVRGEAEDMRKAAEALQTVSDSVAELYAKRTGTDVDTIKTMMAATTYMAPAEQIEHGFATAKPEGDAASVQASLQGAVLMCGGQQFDLQKLPAMPATVLASMLGNAKPNQTQRQAAAGHPATQNAAMTAATPVVQQAGPAGSEKGDGPMDLEKLKAEHPELHTAVMSAGADAERARIAGIQSAAPAGFEQQAALAIEQKQSPEQFALAVLKLQKEQGSTFLQQRKEDAEGAGGANGAPSASGDTPATQQEAQHTAFMAAAKAAAAARAGKK